MGNINEKEVYLAGYMSFLFRIHVSTFPSLPGAVNDAHESELYTYRGVICCSGIGSWTPAELLEADASFAGRVQKQRSGV
jgi:hypothetical protein